MYSNIKDRFVLKLYIYFNKQKKPDKQTKKKQQTVKEQNGHKI